MQRLLFCVLFNILWLRNNGSTFVSQVVDTVLVITILFAGVFPWSSILTMIYSGILFKWFVALFDTPLCYLGRWFLLKVLGDELEAG